MIGLLVALAAGIAPASPISMIAVRELSKLKDRWLLVTLALGSTWLLTVEPWLGVMGWWHVFRWTSPATLPGLTTWTAIGATWFLLRSMPPWAWDWLPWAWLLIAAGHVAWCAVLAWSPNPHARRPLFGLWRTKASQGSPAITALYFALVAPFCPWWGWPVLALGLYLTWSWLALIGVAVGLSVLYPAWAWLPASLLASVLAVWFLSWARGIKLFEWTPRGDSFDSVINRLIVWVLIVRGWWHGPRWLGRGPYSLEPELRRWSSRCWIELPNGEACCDPLHHLYEYGLVGILAGCAFVLPALSSGQLGDPWLASLCAGLAVSLGHYPMRQPAIGLVILTCAAAVVR